MAMSDQLQASATSNWESHPPYPVNKTPGGACMDDVEKSGNLPLPGNELRSPSL
jgi:hypothetical protein